MRSGAKTAVIGGVFAVVASGVGYAGYNLWSGMTGGTATAAAEAPVKRTGPVTADEVDATVKDFFGAWAEGNEAKAAQFTNDPVAAEPVLAAYRADAHIGALKLTPGKATGPKVPFTVNATLSYEGVTKPFRYASELTVVRGLSTGLPRVEWQSSVVHPQLKDGEQLRITTTGAPPVKAVDRKGRELTAKAYPSLRPVLEQLRVAYGTKAGGKPGMELVAAPADGAAGAGTTAAPRTLLALRPGTAGELRTTIDAEVQAAAERAVRGFPESSVAAVEPSSGAIRAVANNRSDGFNAAFLGKQAPGSTMKIVTAALLLEKNLVAADRPAECPREAMYQGRVFHNLDNFDLPAGSPFSESFKRSCNTAFIKLIDDTKDDAALAKEARDVFGIGLDWGTGVPSQDGSVPESSGGEAAAQYIGQGTVQMNALNVASLAATAKSGGFRQPVLVDRSLNDKPPATAARPLDPSAARQLRALMRATATSGTGAKAMAGVGGDKGAKTGSAEVDNQGQSNSWFAGYADDLAAAAVVQSGGHGGDAAGPVVAAVLKAR
ncbi:penicillin-binding transpeptidase domain-containing protein [Streptomyces sp. LP05-1]|uniref:Penicillin-binding transpeptidase domain-containing protein n=1 Tax=Streptomyces pyxinae TaxID=2970734 RepID=A0ABT2CPF4_9ACTN|nr:penicillin-binding transpeptidase domain-containing protein [Streptomyces sp. LP05-1]MCS0639309.1 penicillin-binding transpeptidase domain-containing protein [Streptomyces sp. LP05-1]